MKKTVLFLISTTFLGTTFQALYPAEQPYEGARSEPNRRTVQFYDQIQLTKCADRSEEQSPLEEEIEALIVSQPKTNDQTFAERLKYINKRLASRTPNKKGYRLPNSVQNANTRGETVYAVSENLFPLLKQCRTDGVIPGALEERKDNFSATSAVWGTGDEDLQDDLPIQREPSSVVDRIRAQILEKLLALSGSSTYLKNLESAERQAILREKKDSLAKSLRAIMNFWIQTHPEEEKAALLEQLSTEEGLIALLDELIQKELLEKCINDYLDIYIADIPLF